MSEIAAIAVLEGAALIGAGVLYYLLYQDFTRREKDLLDRLMARNFSEYQLLTPAVKTPLRRRALSDAEMAAREKAARGVAA